MASIAENAGSAAADFLTFASRTADDLAVLFGQADAATRLRDARADLLRIEERLAFIRRQPAFERGTQFRDATREAERLRDLISSLENREGADAAIELALNFTTGATGDQAVQEATEASRLVTEATDRQAAAARSLVDRYDRSGAATRRFADDLGQLDDLLGLPAFHLAAIGQSVEDLTTAREGLLRQRFELDTDFDRGPLDAAVRAARESFEEEARIRREGEADARAYLDALDLTGAAQRRYNDGLLETQRLLAGGFITQEQADSGLRSLQERLGDDLEALGDVDTDGFTQRLRGTLRDSLIAVGQFDDLGDFSDNIFRAVAIELNREAVDNLLDLDFAGIFARLREALEGGLGGLLDGFGGLAGTVLPFGGGRAYGGPVAAGTLYAVGERGPEWFIPNQDGRIVPEAGPGISVTVPLQVQGDVGRATRREALLLQEQAAASAFELAREHAV
ncbi:MAG: hypothetical protein OXI55_16400 [Gammaproteobacteria bacterium]|nr:hypothetical protein [Gammaproteobacteria bacterium]